MVTQQFSILRQGRNEPPVGPDEVSASNAVSMIDVASKVGPIVDDLIAQPTLQVLGGSVDRGDVLFGAFGVGQELITEVTHHLAVG